MNFSRWLLAPFALFALDFGTKFYAVWKIPLLQGGEGFYPFGGIPVFFTHAVTFSLNTTCNTGAAWGLFPGFSGTLFGIRAAIIGALILYLGFQRGSARETWPFWLIVTGAVGNVADYLFYGHVIDFLHWTFWGRSFPIFNCADVYITTGVLALLLLPKRAFTKPKPSIIP